MLNTDLFEVAMEDKPNNPESDFYVQLGKDILKATLITVVTVLVRSLSDILTNPRSESHDDEDY